jgi:hypothetical protein
MIKADQIPDEVLEAMARPVTYPSGASVKYINALHLAAALNAWPGVCVRTRFRPDPNQGGQHLKTEPMLSLPLQETQNAE